MKICAIGKYPQIEGGISARNYWLLRALGERGHKIFVVTNSWAVEDWIKEEIAKEDFSLLEPKNVSLFSLKVEDHNRIFNFNRDEHREHVKHITGNNIRFSDSKDNFPLGLRREKKIFHPLNSDHGVASLTSLAADIVNEYDLDIIYTYYLLPYGVAGLFLKKLTGKPLVVRHATSDLYRLYNLPYLETIFSEVFRNADSIISRIDTKSAIMQKGVSTDNLRYLGMQLPDLNYFNPKVKPFDLSQFGIEEDVPVFSFFGKISSMKKTYNFVNALSRLKKESFKALFVVGGGPSAQKLKQYVHSKGMLDKCIFMPFQPPWKIPLIMRASTCVVAPESYEVNLPVGSHGPQIVNEAVACGRCSIIGQGISQGGYYKDMECDKHLLVVRPEDVEGFSKKLAWVIKNTSAVEDIGKNAYKYAKKSMKNSFVKDFEKILASHII